VSESRKILLLSKEILNRQLKKNLKEHLPEFKITHEEPRKLTAYELEDVILVIGDKKSVLEINTTIIENPHFPLILMLVDKPEDVFDSNLKNIISDIFYKDELFEVILRRIRNTLLIAKGESKIIGVKEKPVDFKIENASRILEASKKLISLRDSETTIIRIITSASSIVNCEGGMMLLADKENKILTGFNFGTCGKLMDSHQEFEIDEGIPGWVYANKTFYICNDPSSDKLFSNEYDNRFHIKSKNMIAVPLTTKNSTLGVLCVYNKRSKDAFSRIDVNLLQEFSDIAAQIVQNTNYFEDHTNFFTQAIKLLIIALEAHDEYFKLHSDNVTNLADRMAEAVGLDMDDFLSVHFAAIFHDIGKLRIDSEILKKQGPLTHLEKKRISLHSIAGEELLKEIKIFNNSTKLIRHHHEWYDGSGFPDGLAGRKIPYGARIINICEAFDTMTSPYVPHRIPLSPEEACQELKDNAGIQFDPELTDIFIDKVFKHL
jgi:putative nucleotidyltransferase with HDIG domain